jgi:hypothetical protein
MGRTVLPIKLSYKFENQLKLFLICNTFVFTYLESWLEKYLCSFVVAFVFLNLEKMNELLACKM